MKRVGIVYLITESPEAAGVLDEKTETRRKTYCEEKSLGMNETYQARASGFAPAIRLILPQGFEYRGETLCEYKGERYSIIRDYTDEKTGNSTELTLERVRGNAAPPAEVEATESEGDPSAALQDDTQGAEETGQAGTGTAATQGEPAETGDTTEIEPAAQRKGSEGSGAPVGQSPQGDSDPNESPETSGANADSGATATIEGAEVNRDV